MLSLIHSSLSHFLHPTHDSVHSTTLSLLAHRIEHTILCCFTGAETNANNFRKCNKMKNTIFISVTQELQHFLPCASRQNKQCNCNDSYSSSRITIESCESARKKKRSESEKITVSLFIHTSRINNSEKLVFYYNTPIKETYQLKKKTSQLKRKPRNFLTLKIFQSSRS